MQLYEIFIILHFPQIHTTTSMVLERYLSIGQATRSSALYPVMRQAQAHWIVWPDHISDPFYGVSYSDQHKRDGQER